MIWLNHWAISLIAFIASSVTLWSASKRAKRHFGVTIAQPALSKRALFRIGALVLLAVLVCMAGIAVGEIPYQWGKLAVSVLGLITLGLSVVAYFMAGRLFHIDSESGLFAVEVEGLKSISVHLKPVESKDTGVAVARNVLSEFEHLLHKLDDDRPPWVKQLHFSSIWFGGGRCSQKLLSLLYRKAERHFGAVSVSKSCGTQGLISSVLIILKPCLWGWLCDRKWAWSWTGGFYCRGFTVQVEPKI